ncbi:hypothetical protein H6F78_07135 [Coleofasciculus sp. FACHB-64]|uniref:hypothetical protein n=1 Tax=Cyanophyceae TaxID=3028117 RepID=UPI0016830D03|nr:hypothetical protein [Coleofasciculus sp. FACHB-64]MBD2045372.1 hypothetical protein [Coleofasciculus sp. FACHB-64]
MYKRIAVVSTFPPTRCGIAVYALQMVEALKRHPDLLLTRISVHPQENVDKSLDLRGLWRFLKLIPVVLSNDRIIINYHKSFFFNSKKYSNQIIKYIDLILSNICIVIVCLIGYSKIEMVCHEVEYIESTHRFKNYVWFLMEKIRWYLTPCLLFHTNEELKSFCKNYGFKLIKNDKFKVIKHGQYFKKNSYATQLEARKILGLDIQIRIFLCIGFISYHKGFDKAIQSFSKTPGERSRLFIVGSRNTSEELDGFSYVELLKKQAIKDERINILERFVSDEEFDMWLISSDYIILPYRQAWSSGVMERAKLYNKTLVVASVGGLNEQANNDRCLLFQENSELDSLLISLCSS